MSIQCNITNNEKQTFISLYIHVNYVWLLKFCTRKDKQYLLWYLKLHTTQQIVCKIKINCPHVRPGPARTSVGVFLRDPSPYLREFQWKTGKTANGLVNKRYRELNPIPSVYYFYRLPEPLGQWWGRWDLSSFKICPASTHPHFWHHFCHAGKSVHFQIIIIKLKNVKTIVSYSLITY